jgi:carbonic anhydrase/acetyltransferase-like protein (isoleucine patch superfamily)
MLIVPYEGEPEIDPSAFVAPTVVLIGRVRIGPDASIWYGSILRADNDEIHIGPRTNIQDLCAVHVDAGLPVVVEEDVTVGHRVILHGCRVGRGSLIGMGAVLLNGSVVGEGSLVGAGSLVSEGMEIPPRTLVMGVPARVLGPVNEHQRDRIARAAAHYVERARRYRALSAEG